MINSSLGRGQFTFQLLLPLESKLTQELEAESWRQDLEQRLGETLLPGLLSELTFSCLHCISRITFPEVAVPMVC